MEAPLALSLFVLLILHGANSAIPSAGQNECKRLSLHKPHTELRHEQCLQHLNYTRLVSELESALKDGRVDAFLHEQCGNWRTYTECVNELVGDITNCLSETELSRVQAAQNAMNAAYNFLCDDSKRTTGFLRSNELRCLQNEVDAIKECTATGSANNHTDLLHQILHELHIPGRAFDSEQCRKYHELIDCIHPSVADCAENSTETTLEQLMLAMLRETPCWSVTSLIEDAERGQMLFLSLLPKHVPTKDLRCPNGQSLLDLATTEVQSAADCWEQHINLDDLMVNAQDAYDNKNFVKFLKNHCPNFRKSAHCIDDFLYKFTPCVNDTDRITIESTRSALHTAIEFICHRDGERVLLFLKDEGIQCFSEQKKALEECAEPIGEFDIEQMFDGDDTQEPSLFWAPQSYDEEECRLMLEVKDCYHRVLRQCSDRTTSNLITSLLKAMLKETPCLKTTEAATDVKPLTLLTLTSLVSLVSTRMFGFA